MTAPKRLWSGEWMAESAAAKARVAGHRAISGWSEDDEADEHRPEAPPPRRRSLERTRRLLLAALAAAGAGWESLVARVRGRPARPRLVPRGRRTRLIAIAVLAGIAGAAAMVGVEAATGAGAGGAPSPAPSRPWLGVNLAASPFEPGALVDLVVPGSPADAAGIAIGDVITSVDGRSVSSPAAAVAALDALRPGTSVALGLDRFGQPLTATVTLGSRPPGAP